MVPEVIELKDLIIRKPLLSDAVSILEFSSDLETVKYMDWPLESNLKNIESRLQERIKNWGSGHGTSWSIVERTSNKMIGTIAIIPKGKTIEIGFIINRHYWFRGYATECAKNVLKCLVETNTINTIRATCDYENKASAKVLMKLGMEKIKIIKNYCVRPNLERKRRDAYLYEMKVIQGK